MAQWGQTAGFVAVLVPEDPDPGASSLLWVFTVARGEQPHAPAFGIVCTRITVSVPQSQQSMTPAQTDPVPEDFFGYSFKKFTPTLHPQQILLSNHLYFLPR